MDIGTCVRFVAERLSHHDGRPTAYLDDAKAAIKYTVRHYPQDTIANVVDGTCVCALCATVHHVVDTWDAWIPDNEFERVKKEQVNDLITKIDAKADERAAGDL